MPIKLIAPLYETFTLDDIDKKYGNDGESTTITIRQATQLQHQQRESKQGILERKFRSDDPDVVSLVSNLNFEDMKREEVYLTLVECNILDEDGKPLFKSKNGSSGRPELAMSKSAFDNAWGKLPPDICEAIHKCVQRVNVMWSRGGEEF